MRQTLRDAWKSTNWEGLCGIPWQMLDKELKLTKKVTDDKEGAEPPLPTIVVERTMEVESRRFYVLSADIELHRHTGGCRGCLITTIIERILSGKARINAYRDRIVERERVKERKRARVERGAGDVLMEPRHRNEKQTAVRHVDASGGDITENPARR